MPKPKTLSPFTASISRLGAGVENLDLQPHGPSRGFPCLKSFPEMICPNRWKATSAIAEAGEDGWLERPLRLVVPFPAGSSTGIIARIAAQR